MRERLVDYGRTRAESLGWTDVYTLTKAFGERIAETRWAGAGHRLSVVRPSIIESALHHPFPGWIDGFKVADPLIIAYGRGQLPEFPGLPDSVLDVIPVDFVVNATLAAAANPAQPEPKYYHVASGASNPLPFHTMHELVHDYFTENPLPDDEQRDVKVPTWRFPGGTRVEKELTRQERKAKRREEKVFRSRALAQEARQSSTGCGRGGTTSRCCAASPSSTARTCRPRSSSTTPTPARCTRPCRRRCARRQGFDVHEIDWNHYFKDIHFPAITTLTRVFASRPAAKAARTTSLLPVRTDVLAVFDLEGTVLESNLVKQYLMLWAGSVPRTPLAARPLRLRRSRPRLPASRAPRPR